MNADCEFVTSVLLSEPLSWSGQVEQELSELAWEWSQLCQVRSCQRQTRLDLCKCAYLLSSCNLRSNALNHGHDTVKKPRLAKTPRLWALKRLSGPSTISIPTWCVPHIFSITLCFLSSESISISSIILSWISWPYICYMKGLNLLHSSCWVRMVPTQTRA